MNRALVSLLATVTALGTVTGVAVLRQPDEVDDAPAPAAARMPVQRTTVLCPPPGDSDLARTEYTALTPATRDGEGKAQPAELLPAPRVRSGLDGEDGAEDGEDGDRNGEDGAEDGTGDGESSGGDGGEPDRGEDAGRDDEPVLSVTRPGTPVTADANDADAPGLAGSAEGPLAPGWTVQQTTTVSAGTMRGVLGTTCSAADTEFWFPGASTAKERRDYVVLTNPDRTPAVVDLALFDKNGPVETATGDGITVPGRSSVPVLLSTLVKRPSANVALQVLARTGRVGAQVQATDAKLGTDWLPPAGQPSPRVVLPGVPADARTVRLAAFAPGDRDVDLAVRFIGKGGTITPAGHETLHLTGGRVHAVDLADLTQGEPGALLLTPADDGQDGAGVVAALRVTRGERDGQDLAFIPATNPVTEQATVADNRAKGSTLSLVAPGKAVRVKVTASAGSDGGKPVSRTYTVKGGTTKGIEPPVPDGLKGRYGLTVQRLSGGDLYAARTLALPREGVEMFTVQTLPDDRSVVRVPQAVQAPSVLND